MLTEKEQAAINEKILSVKPQMDEIFETGEKIKEKESELKEMKIYLEKMKTELNDFFN